MLSFVLWQDDLSAESDDDDEEVSQRLQAQFVTLIDCILYFLSFKFIVYKLLGKLEPKLVHVLPDLNTPQFVWIFFIKYLSVFRSYLITYLNVSFSIVQVSYTNSFIFVLIKRNSDLGFRHLIFNRKRDHCRACFVFRFLLLIWSTAPEKILKLLGGRCLM